MDERTPSFLCRRRGCLGGRGKNLGSERGAALKQQVRQGDPNDAEDEAAQHVRGKMDP